MPSAAAATTSAVTVEPQSTEALLERWPTSNHRRLPLLSEMMYQPIIWIAALLHYVTHPLGIEPQVSMLINGAFFVMLVLPLTMAYGLLTLLEIYVVGRGFVGLVLRYVALPLSVLYFVLIIILDKTHLQVQNANPRRPHSPFTAATYKFFSACMEYFPTTIVPWTDDATLPVENGQQYIFAVHPHGIHCMPLAPLGGLSTLFSDRFPGLLDHKLTGLAATVVFKIPLVREMFLNMGYVDASRSVASDSLQAGRSLFICTGGEEESMYTEIGRDIVVLKNRKGFIRLALSYGADLVPIFGAGLSDFYKTYGFMNKQRLWIQKNLGVALPIFHGQFFSPLPYQVPLTMLIGEPIKVPKPTTVGAKPDAALVDEYHAKYVEALKTLHSKHVKDRVLEIR